MSKDEQRQRFLGPDWTAGQELEVQIGDIVERVGDDYMTAFEDAARARRGPWYVIPADRLATAADIINWTNAPGPAASDASGGGSGALG